MKIISRNICLCTSHLQQYRINWFVHCASNGRFCLHTKYHTISPLEDSIFHTFSNSKSKPVLKCSLVSIIKLMWVAAELINHMGCNKSTPIPVLGRSHDLSPWIIPLSAGTAQVEVSSKIFMSPPLKGSPSGCQEVIQSPKQQIPGSC